MDMIGNGKRDQQALIGNTWIRGVNQLPTMEGETVLDMLSRKDVISYLRTLQTPGA